MVRKYSLVTGAMSKRHARLSFSWTTRHSLRTGDLGYRDDEGYFHFTDRLKRMINASGYKVWPAEVEAIMYRHPEVRDCCIVGTGDPYRGETVKAIVVRTPGSRLEADALVDWARAPDGGLQGAARGGVRR